VGSSPTSGTIFFLSNLEKRALRALRRQLGQTQKPN
jgi:hypothetical protein